MKNTLKAAAFILGGSLIMSSCYKKFDENNYAPPLNIGGYTSSDEIQSAALVAKWSFDGNLHDAISNTDGTNAGATFATGIKGQAYKGSATGYVTFNPGTTIQNLHSYTVAFWMNCPVNSGAIGIFTIARTDDFWGNLDIYQDGGSGDQATLKVHMFNQNVSWGGQFIDTKIGYNKWVHIAATYDAATSKFNIYQNGTAIGVNSPGNTAGAIGPTLNGSDPAVPPVTPYGSISFKNPGKIGFGAFQFQTTPPLTTTASAQSWASNFTGSMDEFRIYNIALTAAEVSALVKLEGRGK